MTVTTRKQENDLTPGARYQQHETGRVIRVIRSDSGITYKVCLKDGKVKGCEAEDGELCKSFYYRSSCHHATLAMQLEAEREQNEELRFSPWHGSNRSQESYLPPLHGSQGFSLLKK
jgi:hypothetical protein